MAKKKAPKKTKRPASAEPRKYAPRVRLPLSFDDAVAGLLATGPPDKKAKDTAE